MVGRERASARRLTALGRVMTSLALSAVVGCTGTISGPASTSPSDTGDSAGTSGRGGGAGAGGAAARGAGQGGSGSVGAAGDDPAPSACTQPGLGATPLQRIGRVQYVNSVRDLLHVALDAAQLPEDEQFGAFDGNIVVPITDLVVEQYVNAAEASARLALPEIEALVPCDREALGDAACVTQFIETFGKRAYRRPLVAEEAERYEELYTVFADQGYPDALRIIVQTMLQSPNYLYRVELMPSAATGGSIESLDAYELASRLSFFLLSTTPDDTLLEAAGSGDLLDPDELMAQADRLLQDDRFTDTLASFHLQWLDLKRLDSLAKDAELFPMYSSELGPAMRDETLRFVDYVIREDDALLSTLLTAPYAFPSGPLLELYGLSEDEVESEGPTMVDNRAGLLTQPAFLAAHSHYNQTSPVQRGKVIIRNVLCQALPDPPPNVNATPPDPSPDATTRERLAQHQNDTSCRACHKRIDGIGLGFESYDALGAFRSMESGKTIDATGTIIGTDQDGDFDGALQLAERLARSGEAERCMTTQWLRFALGRPETAADECTLEQLNADFAASGGDIRQLLRSIVASDAFRSKLVPEGMP
jgi:hypothetical protein